MPSMVEKARRQARGFASMFKRYRDKPFSKNYGIIESNHKKNYAVAATQIVQKQEKPLTKNEKRYLYQLAGKLGEDDQEIMKRFRMKQSAELKRQVNKRREKAGLPRF